jgi:GntR family transcriptional regulator/MocR family aminotransferase
LVYVTPSHQFPTGAVMSLSRRLALLDWAEERDAFILEDDYDGDYRYEGRPIEAVQGLDSRGRTLYVGTASKVLFPALRLGFLVLPRSLVSVFRAGKWLADRHCASLEQLALAAFLETGLYERHLRRMRRRHAARRAALIAAIERHLGDRAEVMGTGAGIHVVLWLPQVPPARLPALIEAAAGRGVGLYSIAPYYLEGPPRTGLLLGYGNLDETAIEEGIARLGSVLVCGKGYREPA